MTATSTHGLNGDRPLGRAGQLKYFFYNWLNNRHPQRDLDDRIEIRPFVLRPELLRSACLTRGASPSRKLCDLFWATLPWQAVAEELGGIRAVDVGCGSGRYAALLKEWSGDRVASYTGIDVTPRDAWRQLESSDSTMRFVAASAADFHLVAPAGCNLIVSQSAIEHIDEDLTFFEGVRDVIEAHRNPVVQIHLCPSEACLRLFLLHGVRQYTPRTLSMISRLFADASIQVVQLGGRACNRLHFTFVTWPLNIRGVDYRRVRADEYERLALEAIERDMRRPSLPPSFYALVIHSRPRRLIFSPAPSIRGRS